MLPQNLAKLRKQKKMTQKQVAERLHISPQAYARYEKTDDKRSEPSAENLKILAELFEVSTDYLLGKETVEPESLMFNSIDGFKDLPLEEQKRIEENLIEQALFMIERAKKK